MTSIKDMSVESLNARLVPPPERLHYAVSGNYNYVGRRALLGVWMTFDHGVEQVDALTIETDDGRVLSYLPFDKDGDRICLGDDSSADAERLFLTERAAIDVVIDYLVEQEEQIASSLRRLYARQAVLA